MTVSLYGVKGKLDIPDEDASKDDLINPVLYAARQYVLDATRYAVDVATGIEDLFEGVQAGKSVILSKRPVTQIVSVETRAYQKTPVWTAIDYDLVSSAEGRLKILGTEPGLSMFPPEEGVAPWFRWRQVRFQIVKVKFDVGAATITDDLANAIEDLAAFWFTRGIAGAADSMSMGGISESYSKAPIPPWIHGVLARHAPRRAVWL